MSSEMRHCPKCGRWSCEPGYGKGRQYRCHICGAARLRVMQQRKQEPQRQAA